MADGDGGCGLLGGLGVSGNMGRWAWAGKSGPGWSVLAGLGWGWLGLAGLRVLMIKKLSNQ